MKPAGEATSLPLPRSEGDVLKEAARLRGAGQFAEADAVLAEGTRLFPDHLPIAMQFAGSAGRLGQAEEEVRRWKGVAYDFPDQPDVYAALCTALNSAGRLDEADRLSAITTQKYPDHPGVLRAYASTAAKRRDWADSFRRHSLVKQRFPKNVGGWDGAAWALAEMGRLDEAEVHITEARREFPNDPRFLSLFALIAEIRHDWAAAGLRLDALVAADPNNQAGHHRRVAAWRRAGRLDAAQQALAAGLARFPDFPALRREASHLAEAVAKRRQAAGGVHGEAAPKALLDAADALIREKRFTEATACLDAEKRFSGDPEVELRHALIARRTRRLPEAIRRFSALLERMPTDYRVLQGLAESHFDQRGDKDACEQAIRRLVAEHPGQIPAIVLSARFLMWQNRGAEAVDVLTDAERRFPGNPHILPILGDARVQARLEALMTGGDQETPSLGAQTYSASQKPQTCKELVERFISLGGDENGCEFGNVQRYHGAEPLGLLRWGGIPPEKLVKLLNDRCRGIDLPGNLSLRPDHVGEYRLADSTYQISMHTFISASDQPVATLLPKIAKRQGYLARLLLETLSEAQSIFVYKTLHKLAPGQIEDIWLALRSHGPNTLLIVQLADEDRKAGSLEAIKPGLMIGALDRFSIADTAFGAWTELCWAAWRLWAEERQGLHLVEEARRAVG